MEIADKVKEIVSQQLDVDVAQIKPESQFILPEGCASKIFSAAPSAG